MDPIKSARFYYTGGGIKLFKSSSFNTYAPVCCTEMDAHALAKLIAIFKLSVDRYAQHNAARKVSPAPQTSATSTLGDLHNVPL